jgi:hypothetical protein
LRAAVTAKVVYRAFVGSRGKIVQLSVTDIAVA